MANCMIGFPNRIDAGTLSGGGWLAALPLSNLQSRIIGKVARSNGLTLANTQFDINLGSAKNTRLLSFVNHNFSLAARYRLRGGNDATFATTLVDTGWQDVWPVVYPPDAVDWEEDNWWSGKYTQEQISGYTTALVVILAINTVAQYWRLEIDDSTNAAGYVQIGRVFVGPAWQPTYNMSYGGSNGWETQTKVQRALGGAKYFQRRTPYRVAKFTLRNMTTDEGLATAFELDRRAGIDQEVFWIHDTADTLHALRRRFLGTLRQLSPIEYPYFNNSTKAYEIEELL